MGDWRAEISTGLAALFTAEGAAADLFTAEADIGVSAPVGQLYGAPDVAAHLFAPLRAAFAHRDWRDLLVLGGENQRDDGGQWVVTLSHLAGIFRAPLWGVRPHGRLVHLRLGGFWRVEAGRIVRARLIFDLIDLMFQTGQWTRGHYGAPLSFPAPATQSGICPVAPDRSAGSLAIVEGMLGDLHSYDPTTFGSPGQTGRTGFWADDFAWYGPGGIGATVGWRGFVEHHRAPFLHAFPDRRGGNHYVRLGDGDYAAVSGWPSMTMTHQAPYLGVAASGKPLTLRVMDFYRCADGKIAENWVLLDYVDLMRQMGVDPLA